MKAKEQEKAEAQEKAALEAARLAEEKLNAETAVGEEIFSGLSAELTELPERLTELPEAPEKDPEVETETVRVLEADEESDELPVIEKDEEDSLPAAARKKPKWVKGLIITGITLVALVAAGIIAAFFIFNHFYNKSTYVGEGETYIPTAASTEPTSEEEIREGVNYSIVGTTEETTTTTKEENEDETEPSIDRTGVYNVLLIGIDDGSGVGNSDSMIICSINYDLHKIFLTTIMRDIEADVPGYGLRKINSACAINGPTLLVDTFEQYFGFEIDNWALINFEGMKSVVNALGGVDLPITVAEADFMKIKIDEDMIIHLDGRLALRHARDRSSGGSDFGRTQRQRNVLMAIVKKARRGDLGDLVKAAESILPYIVHDMSRRDLLEIIRELPVLVKWEFIQQRLPYDGLYTYNTENIVIDVPASMERWHAVVYDGETFEDTITEEAPSSDEETAEPSGEGREDPGSGEESTEPTEASAEESSGEEPEYLPEDLVKLPDGLYRASFKSELYLKKVPEDFRILLTITTSKTVSDPDELAVFDATGPRALNYEIGVWNDRYYIGRRGRYWQLEKYETE